VRRRPEAPRDPVRLAVIGAGGIAQAYAHLLADSPDAVAVGVTDVRPEAAQAWAASVGCPVAESPEALLDLEPDAVVICTPPSTHADLAATFLGNDVAVLSEKPLSINQESARSMTEMSDHHETMLAMAAKFRFCQDLQRSVELMADGSLGSIRLIENAFTSRIDMSQRWNSQRPLSGGGVIIDNGTHSVDLVSWLGGAITEVRAEEQARPHGFEVEDTARLHLVTENGIDVTVDLSWSIDKALPDFVRVFGTEGELRVGWQSSAWRRYDQHWEPIGTGYSKFEAMGGALAQFCRAVRGDERPAVDGRSAVRTAAVIDAAYDSLATGTWTKVVDDRAC